MKKISLSIATVFLLATSTPTHSMANTENTSAVSASATPKEAKEAEVLLARLNEIVTMEKKDLSSAERKQLKNEVKSIKEQLVLNQGVYLSIGAIIIIILLLILIL